MCCCSSYVNREFKCGWMESRRFLLHFRIVSVQIRRSRQCCTICRNYVKLCVNEIMRNMTRPKFAKLLIQLIAGVAGARVVVCKQRSNLVDCDFILQRRICEIVKMNLMKCPQIYFHKFNLFLPALAAATRDSATQWLSEKK